MAWFRNGKKYWKHNGKIYSSRIKRRSSFYESNKSNSRKKYSDYIGPKFDEPKNFYIDSYFNGNKSKFYIKKNHATKTISNNINDFDVDYISILEGNSGKYYYHVTNSKKTKNYIKEIDKDTANKYIEEFNI